MHMIRSEDAKKLLLRDHDPFLSLVRPLGLDTSDLDEEFLTLKKSYEDQKRSGAIPSVANPKKSALVSLTKCQKLPCIVTSTDLETKCLEYKIANFARLPQKLNDPVVVKWLETDFERDDGASVPRSFMYGAYLEFCRLNRHCVSNQACFGKSVRNVFPHLQTRRIGVRGNSKYHYFGIRPKPGTTTEEFFTRKETRANKSIRSVKKHLRLENFNNETRRVNVPAVKIKEEPGTGGGFKHIVHILIPDFPTHQTLNVSKNVLKEAHILLDCMEKYAADILRETMQSPEKSSFQQVFAATANHWKTVCEAINEDTMLTHPDILALTSECDTKLQTTIRDLLLPDLLAPVTAEKREALRKIFSGMYLKEMMQIMQSAPEQVRHVKKRVYKKFSTEMLERLDFLKLLWVVDQSFENQPISRILQKAFQKIDVDCIISKCRFAFAMKEPNFLSTEKLFRQGLSTFEASLNNDFHLRGCLNWVRSQVLNQIQIDKEHSHYKEKVTVTLLCFSYATSLVFADLVKHVPLQLQSGLRNVQLLLGDYVGFAIQDELKGDSTNLTDKMNCIFRKDTFKQVISSDTISVLKSWEQDS